MIRPITMFQQLRTIGSNTFIESMRQPVYLVLLILVIGLLTLVPAFSAFTLEDDNKLIVDIGLSTMFLAGLFIAAFTASGTVAEEIERKTVLLVASKPIPRPLFILGKFLGVYGSIAVAHWIWSLVFLLVARHRLSEWAPDAFDLPALLIGGGGGLLALGIGLWWNYFRGRVFSSIFTGSLAIILPLAAILAFLFNQEWHLQSPQVDLNSQVLLALLLVLEAHGILCAVAVAVSTRLGNLATLAVMGLVFLLGLTNEYFFGSSGGGLFASLGQVVAPNFQFLWVADAITQGHPVSLDYVGLVSFHALLYTMAVLSLAVMLFQTRELG